MKLPEHLARFAEHRTHAEVKKLLHHAHWIPQTKGFTQQHIDEHWSGNTFNSLLRVWKAAGIVTHVSGLGAVVTPSGVVGEANDLRDFRMIHFNNAQEWAVEWPDGSWTSSSDEGGLRATLEASDEQEQGRPDRPQQMNEGSE